MPSITVTLTEEQLLKLNEIALRLKIPLEQIVQIGVEELIARPDSEFQKAMEYVLGKNSELYRRLA